MRLSLILPVALIGLVPAACVPNDQADDPSQMGNGQQPPPAAYPQGQTPPGQAYPAQPMPPGQLPQQNPPGQLPPGQPGGAPHQGGGQATPIPAAAAMAASIPITAMAQQEAPGMQPDGGAFAGQFQEGQVLEHPINLAPNKCYTIIGVGAGVTDLSIQLVTQPMPGMPPVPLAQSAGSGPNATLGGNKQCWKFMSPIGVPGKVLLKANKGSGMAAAQVFVK
jgi:hypothetical protein